MITVLFQDTDGEEIDESKELSISESFDLKEESRKIEGYVFTKGYIGENEITSIVKKTAEIANEEEVIENSDDVDSNESKSEYIYYEAVLADGNILVIDENADLRLVYTKVNEKDEFEYENDGIKVTVKLSDPSVLPAGVELSVKAIDESTEGYNYNAYIDALNENAKNIAQAKGTDEVVEYDSNNVVLFDICFMYGEKEFQLEDGTASVSIVFTDNTISEGLGTKSSEDVTVVHMPLASEVLEKVDSTKDATEISSSDISVEVLADSMVELDGNADAISFETDSFSAYGAIRSTGDHTWDGSETFTAEEIVSMFGDATYFGVVANTYDGNNNHSEANIAVKSISNIQQFSVGNSTTVYTHLTDYKVTVDKVVYGSSSVEKFNFAFFSDIDGRNKISGSEFSITTGQNGRGSITLDVAKYLKSHGSLYVYELDQNGNAVLNGGKAGNYTVTYEGDAIEGNADIVSYFSDNYIENIGSYRITGDDGILQKVEGATVYYKTSDSTYVGVQYISGGEVVRTYEGEFPVNIDAMRADAREASSRLAYATSGNNVTVVNIVGTAGNEYSTGSLQKDLTEYYFAGEEDNYAVNTGFYIPSNNLLLINVDLTGIATYTYDKIKVNNLGTGDWSDIANQMVVNFVEKDSNGNFVPYKGNLITDTASGLLVAPDADVKLTSSYSGTVIADDVDKECELHKITVRRYLSENGTATVTNTLEGAVTSIQLYKYLNDGDPGDHQFTFTVKALTSDGKRLETLTDSLTNIGSSIAYTFDFTKYVYAHNYVYLVISENDVDDSNIKKDEDYIIVRITNPGTAGEIVEYCKYDSENSDHKAYIDHFKNNNVTENDFNNKFAFKHAGNFISDPTKVAFYNEGAGLLRIHKMVVNNYSSDIVRDDPNSILEEVTFRITNKATGMYLVFEGFVGKAKISKVFYDSDGNPHTVTYNEAAQWTIEGLPAGTYIVEEVGDGFTFEYDYEHDTSYVISSDLCRVTKYDVTEDDEDYGSDGKNYGIGGSNWRKLFACDVPGQVDDPPQNVLVGGKTQTVQICNYYSIPIGPIQFTKNFAGGEWTSNMSFEFKIEPVGYQAFTSENNPVTLPEQPMPVKRLNKETVVTEDTVTLTGADATYNSNTGVYTATAKFASIPFRYKGTYVYKITETDTGIDGVKYDEKTYYVRFDVKHKFTTFKKQYSYDSNKHSIYVQQGNKNTVTKEEEFFYYLGADVTYATDAEFKNTVAYCSLTLGPGVDTVHLQNNEFLVDWHMGGSENVAFNNTLTGNLTVEKEWFDIEGNKSPDGHTSLKLDIWQRTVGSNEWQLYTGTSVVLSSDNNWKQTVTGLPLQDNAGNAYEYCVKESDEYLATYDVVYTYGGNTYNAKDQSKITVNGSSVRDTGYIMQPGNDGISYGNVTITNRSVVTNTIPSTGGIGTSQFVAIGVLLMSIAFAGMMLFKKRRVF